MRKRRKHQEELEGELIASADEGGPEAGSEASSRPPPEAASRVGGPAGPRDGHRVTPVDIQQKVFRSAFRGYSEREVDVFLDEVTEEMARLLAETRSLRDQLQRAEMRATTPLGFADDRAAVQAREEAARLLQRSREEADRIVREAGDDAERMRDDARAAAGRSTTDAGAPQGFAADAALVGAAPAGPPPTRDFIHREREFLQRLAELIQSHAEAIREDLRRSKGGPEPEPPSGAAPSGPAEGSEDHARATPHGEAVTEPAVAEDATSALGSAEVGMMGVGPADAPVPETPSVQAPAVEGPAADAPTAEPAAEGVPPPAEQAEEPTEEQGGAESEAAYVSLHEPGPAGDPAWEIPPSDETSPPPAPSSAVDFAVDLERDGMGSAAGSADDLLPWESEPTRSMQAPAAEPATAPEQENVAPAEPTHEPTATGLTRPFGNAPRGGVQRGEGPATGATSLERAHVTAPAPGEDREDEQRSLRELFWGED
jgi:DivIVA domain-containing protein